MSDSAIAFLEQTGIIFEYAKRTKQIMNRGGTGMCPMEREALLIEDPAEAFRIFDGLLSRNSS